MVVVVVEWKLRHGPGVVAATRRSLRELVSRRRRSPRAGRGRVADRWDVVHPRRRRRTQPRRRRRRRRGAARAAAAPEERPRRDAVAEVGRHRPRLLRLRCAGFAAAAPVFTVLALGSTTAELSFLGVVGVDTPAATSSPERRRS